MTRAQEERRCWELVSPEGVVIGTYTEADKKLVERRMSSAVWTWRKLP